MTHSYVNSVTATGGATNYSKQMDSSERQHLLMLNHFSKPDKENRISESFERFAKSPVEHERTVKAIRNYKNKNHKPV